MDTKPKEIRIPPVIQPEELAPYINKIDWIRDPIPPDILHEIERVREYIHVAAELHAREIDLEVQTLNLEKERIQTLMRFV